MRLCLVSFLFLQVLQERTTAFSTLHCKTPSRCCSGGSGGSYSSQVLRSAPYPKRQPSRLQDGSSSEVEELEVESLTASIEDGNLSSKDEEDSLSTSKQAFSKSRWKKKRYLMMQDVKERIKRGDFRAPKKAQDMIDRMQKLSELHDDKDLRPTVQAYNHWINAIAKCWRKPDAGQRAEAVLGIMKQNGVQPSVVSYTMVMDAYAESSTRNNEAAQQAERVLFDLIEQQETNPNLKISSITCDTVLKAWAKRGNFEGAQRAQDILERLELLQNAEVRPTAHSYGAVVHAWATCNGGVEAAEKAEAILQRMLKAKDQKDRQAVRPDTVVFNSVIHAWANSRDSEAGTRAVALLKRMRELHDPKNGFETAPDIVTYNSVLAAWSQSKDMNAAAQTERILKDMQEAYKASAGVAPAPNTISFNSVLHAWSRSPLPGAVDRAQAVLDFMIRSQNEDIFPDKISFTSVLNALAKSKDPEKATKARKLLITLLEMYETTKRPRLKPSQIPFNTVLNACAFSASETTPEQQRQALQIAITTFSEMKEYSNPDTVSYGNLMKCFNNLMPPGERRNEMALSLLNECLKNGLVGELVWNEVRRAVQSRVLSNALGLSANPNSLQLKDLPKNWTNQVHGDKLAARRRSQARNKAMLDKRERKNAASQRFPTISEPSFQSGKDL